METVWFLVQLFAASSGYGPNADYWTLRQGHMPIPFSTGTQCHQAGLDLMVDSRNKRISLHCIEAWDEQDLHDIMIRNFRFEGDII